LDGLQERGAAGASAAGRGGEWGKDKGAALIWSIAGGCLDGDRDIHHRRVAAAIGRARVGLR